MREGEEHSEHDQDLAGDAQRVQGEVDVGEYRREEDRW
jgi:hypothetical protein